MNTTPLSAAFEAARAPRSVRSLWLPLLNGAFLLATGLEGRAQLLDVQRIWDHAPHNAFTDLVRHRGEWLCVFREGQAHVSPDGALRVITSRGGRTWTSAALLTSTNGDLRDAKLTVTPTGELMLSGAVAWPQPGPVRHRSLAWFSRDGRAWSPPVELGDTNLWLWRITWNKRTAYSVGYDTAGEKFVRLYRSADGRHFDTLVPRLFEEGSPNESALVFAPDGTALCLLRRDQAPSTGPGQAPGTGTAMLGRAQPPYTNWVWRDLGLKIGGPDMLRLPDGRIVAAVRLYDGAVRTSLAWLEPDAGRLNEFLKLPSGGDTSYAGMVLDKGVLWVSYYSSHEGKTSIYLARVRLPGK